MTELFPFEYFEKRGKGKEISPAAPFLSSKFEERKWKNFLFVDHDRTHLPYRKLTDTISAQERTDRARSSRLCANLVSILYHSLVLM